MDKERAQKVQTILVESRIQKSDKPMIDGIKLELKNPDFAHQIRLNPNFDFINEVNEKTGVIEDCKTAKYKNITIRAVSYTHLTLPTICSVQISVVAVSLKKKKKQQ
eukprot:TRINITY_DN11963_c0_g1_i1.p4 TRINITY_DN11963_c0_g1~~TRINITY_DN11963_c0_g1_i1.p4  ORF type:complete len:107 (+),score=11.93 TRINITY_DN11963_c0_g1_i1:795-1115(+)